MNHEKLLFAYQHMVPLTSTSLWKKFIKTGVKFVSPNSVYISSISGNENEITIGGGTVVLPNVFFIAPVHIGKDCIIGPGQVLSGVKIGDNAELGARPSVMESDLGNNVRIGRNTEIVRSRIGENSSIQHFRYVGDACVGAGVNIGAGVVVANYDGFGKNITHIQENVFVGSNSTIVAPVIVGRESFIGAGTTVRKGVPANSVVVGKDRILSNRRCVKKGKNWIIIKE